MNEKINVKIFKLSKENSVIYFADSLDISIKDVKEIIHLFKKNCNAEIGFHTW